MNKNKLPYNDFFQKKLDNHESTLSDGFFDHLMSDRSMRQKLDNHNSPVNDAIFNQLMHHREGSDEQLSDTPLRERLAEHTSAVPKHIFNAIIAERDRRRRSLMWRSATAILLFFITYLMFLNRHDNFNKEELKTDNSIDFNNTQSQANNEFNQNKKDNSLIVNNENIIHEKNTKIDKELKTNDNNYKTGISNNKTFNNKENKEVEIDNKDKVLNNDNKFVVGNKDKSFVNNNKFLINNKQSTINNKQSKNTEGSISKFKQINIQQSIINSHPSNAVSNSANIITEHTAPQQTIIPTFSENTGLTTVLDLGEKGVDGKDLKRNNSVVFNPELSTPDALNGAFDNLSILKVKNIPLPSKILENPCAGPGDGCPTFGKKRSRGDNGKSFYVDIYGAPEYAFRRLTENLAENSSYLRARDSVEQSWYAFSAGVRISLVFGNGLAVRTGFAYAQTNEIAVFDSLGIGKKIITETYVPRTGSGQDTIRKTEITSGIFRTTRYNRYRSVDIPLQVGFELPLNDYWTFSINGGANFNISAWRKADILGDKGTRIDVSSGLGESNPVFNNSLGISVFGSVAAYRQLTGNLQLVIEPSVRHYLQPITRSDYALKQAYTNGGLIMGLRYRF